jgi:hypothetical protein
MLEIRMIENRADRVLPRRFVIRAFAFDSPLEFRHSSFVIASRVTT